MAINIKNMENSNSTIVLNNAIDTKLNVENHKDTKSYIEVNGGKNNDINIKNTMEEDSFLSPFSMISVAIIVAIFVYYAFIKKEDEKPEIEKEDVVEDNPFVQRKNELNFIISSKVNSSNLKNRMNSIVDSLEDKYNENCSIIANLKFKKNGIESLTKQNNLILEKMTQLINDIEINHLDFDIDSLDEILKYIDLVEKAKSKG